MGQKKTILYKKIGGDVTECAKMNYSKPSNPNLLDNPDFKINQRGLDEYLFSNGSPTDWYCLDRWNIVSNAKCKVAINDDGSIRFSPTGYADEDYSYAVLQQRTPKIHVGDTVTLSMAVKGSGIMHLSQINSDCTTISLTDEYSIYSVTIPIRYSPDSGAYGFGVSFNTNINNPFVGVYVDIKWIKAELGSEATPFVPPDPAVELLKCQRYYQRFVLVGGGVYFPGVFDENVIDISVPLIEQMRVLPTLNFKDITKFICLSSHNDILTFSDAVIYSYTHNTVTLRLTRNYTEGEVLRGSCILRATDHNYLDLIADL